MGKTAAFVSGQNTPHLQWLQTIADRAACGLLVLEGSSLFNDESAKMVRKHFGDVIDGLAKGSEELENAPLEPASGEE